MVNVVVYMDEYGEVLSIIEPDQEEYTAYTSDCYVELDDAFVERLKKAEIEFFVCQAMLNKIIEKTKNDRI